MLTIPPAQNPITFTSLGARHSTDGVDGTQNALTVGLEDPVLLVLARVEPAHDEGLQAMNRRVLHEAACRAEVEK